MCVADQIIDTISECVRSASCPGGCQEQCGSNMQEEQGSAQDVEYSGGAFAISTNTDECIRNISCPGDCQGICKMSGSNIMQGAQGSAHDIEYSLQSNQKTQEFGRPDGKNHLESRSGQVGGFVGTQIYVPENNMSGEKGNNPVSASVSVPTVHKNCTLLQPVYRSTMALDWTRVGGVVLEGLGLCKNIVSESAWRPKYTPDWEYLPGWVHPR